MHFTCTIYNQDYGFGGTSGSGDHGSSRLGGDDTGDPAARTRISADAAGRRTDGVCVVARVEVSGRDRREAAARAYVRCVGRDRARVLRQKRTAPRNVIAQETNWSAIAASLRKTTAGVGECYEMDNLYHGWLITVEPVEKPVDHLVQWNNRTLPLDRLPRPENSSPRPQRRLRLPLPRLVRLLRSPYPN